MSQGVVYGDYFLLGRLAKGGMAEVFLAKQLASTRGIDLLAVKRTLPQFAANDEFSSMFIDEARIARALEHPNICRIVDHGQVGNQLFIVMEFIHGKDLRVVQKRAAQRDEPIPYRFAAYALAQIARALDCAHSLTNDRGEREGIVHRDISPQNILVSYDGVPKLIDFGIAKAKDRLAQTRVGVVKGKFAYMSPEQAAAGEVDWRSDLFALGVTLYELVTGRLPFKGSSDFSTLKRIARGEYTRPDEITTDIPLPLVRIIERSLERDVSARYQSGIEMANDIESMLVDEGGTDAASFSSYLRKLFRDDYVRESSRIRHFEAIEPPAEAVAKADKRRRRESMIGVDVHLKSTDVQIVDESDDDDALQFDEPTVVAASLDLAAGFDAAATVANPSLAQGPVDEPIAGRGASSDTQRRISRKQRRVSAPVDLDPSEFDSVTTEYSSQPSVRSLVHDADLELARGAASAAPEATNDDPISPLSDTSEEDNAPGALVKPEFFDEETQESKSIGEVVQRSDVSSAAADESWEFIAQTTDEFSVNVNSSNRPSSPRAEALVAEVADEFSESTRDVEPNISEHAATRVESGAVLLEEARRAAQQMKDNPEQDDMDVDIADLAELDAPTQAVNSDVVAEAARFALEKLRKQDRIEAEIAAEARTRSAKQVVDSVRKGARVLEISEPEFNVPSNAYVIEPDPHPPVAHPPRAAGALTGGELFVLVFAALIGAGVVLGSYYVASHGLPEFAANLLDSIMGSSE